MAMTTELYTRLVSGVLFPLHERMKGHTTVAVRESLEQTQWWSPGQLRALQLDRLRSLLAYAGATVPYYRDLFREHEFSVEHLDSLEDLRRLPVLTKSIIRVNAERLKSEKAKRLSRFTTGGSSGEPLTFFIGSERVAHDVAAKWRATRWWDVDIGDPEIVVWGSPIEIGAQDRLRMLRDWSFRTELLPAFEMSEAKLESFLGRIRAARPKMLFGYPSALSQIARHADKRGIRMDDLGIRVAFVTSERLYDEQRGNIGRVFGCPVANGYGGRDAGFIAHECPEGGMHITAEDIIVEILNEDGNACQPGAPGEMFITHLATREFPFVRYRTGDVGCLGTDVCACGRGLPLLKDLQGRTTDFVVARNGTVMHGLALIYVMRELPGIESFKIVQESLERTRVFLVPAPGFEREVEQRIVEGIRTRLGRSVEVLVEIVDRLPMADSGKFRYIESRVHAFADVLDSKANAI